jgi:hypothetical protein
VKTPYKEPILCFGKVTGPLETAWKLPGSDREVHAKFSSGTQETRPTPPALFFSVSLHKTLGQSEGRKSLQALNRPGKETRFCQTRCMHARWLASPLPRSLIFQVLGLPWMPCLLPPPVLAVLGAWLSYVSASAPARFARVLPGPGQSGPQETI